MLNRIELDGFSAFHSVTSTFEFLATYLVRLNYKEESSGWVLTRTT